MYLSSKFSLSVSLQKIICFSLVLLLILTTLSLASLPAEDPASDDSIRSSLDDRHRDLLLPSNEEELRKYLTSFTEGDLEQLGLRTKDGAKFLFAIFEDYFQTPPRDRLFTKIGFRLIPNPSKLKHASEFFLWDPYLIALRTSAKLGWLPAIRILANNSYLFVEYKPEQEPTLLPPDEDSLKEFLSNQPIDALGQSAFYTPNGAKILYEFFFSYFSHPRDSREFLHPSIAQTVEELKTKEPGILLRNKKIFKRGAQHTPEIEKHFTQCKLALLIAAWLHHPRAQSFIDQNPNFFPENKKPYPFTQSFVKLQTDNTLLLSIKNKYLEDKCFANARYVLQKLISLCLNDLSAIPSMFVAMNSFFQLTQTIEGFLTSEQLKSIPERLDPTLDSNGCAEIDKIQTLCSLISEYKTILRKELESKKAALEDSTRSYEGGRVEYSQDLSQKLAYYTDFKDSYLFYFRVCGEDVPLEDYRLARERFFEAVQDLVVTAQQVSVPDPAAFQNLKTELYRLAIECTKREQIILGDEQPAELAENEHFQLAKRYSDALSALSQDKILKPFAWQLLKLNLEAYLAIRAQTQSEFSAPDRYQLFTLFRALGDHIDVPQLDDEERLKLYAKALDHLEEYLKQNHSIDDSREAAEAYLAVARRITNPKNTKQMKAYCKKSTDYIDIIMSDPVAKIDLNYFPQAKKMILEAMTLCQTEQLFVDECYSALAIYVEGWIGDLERGARLAGPSVRVDPSNYTTAYDSMMLLAELIKHNPMLELDCYLKALHYFRNSLPNPLEPTQNEREKIYNICFDFGDRVTDPLGKARLYKKGMEDLEHLFSIQEQKCSREELLELYEQCLNRSHTSRIPQPSLELYWKIIRYMGEAAKAAAFCSDNETMLKWCQGVLEYSQELVYLLPHPYYAPQELYALKELAEDVLRNHNALGSRQTDEETLRQSSLLQKINNVFISDMSLKKLSETARSTRYPNLPSYLKKAKDLLDGLPRKARGATTSIPLFTEQPQSRRNKVDQDKLKSAANCFKETADAMKLQALDRTRPVSDLEKVDLLSRAGGFYEKRIGVLAPFATAGDCKDAYIVYKELYELIDKTIWPAFLTQVRQAKVLSSNFHEDIQDNDTNLSRAQLISKQTARSMNQLLRTLSEHDPIDTLEIELHTFDDIAPTLEELPDEYKDLYARAASVDRAACEVRSRLQQLMSDDILNELKTAMEMAATFSAKTVDHLDWKPQNMTGEELAYSKAFMFQTLSLRHAQEDKNIWKKFDQARRYLINAIECPHTRPENSPVSPKSYLQKASELRDEAIRCCPFDSDGELIEGKRNLVHLHVVYSYLCAEVTQIWVDSLGENSFLKNFETVAEAHLNAYHALRKANKAKFSAYSKNRSAKEELRLLDLYVMNLKKKLDVQWVLNDAKGDFIAFAAMYLEAASRKGKNPLDLIELTKCATDTATCRRNQDERFALLQKGCEYSDAFFSECEKNAALSLDPKLLFYKDGKSFREICRSLTETYLEAAKCALDVNDRHEALYKIVTHLNHVGIPLLPERKGGWDDSTFYEVVKLFLLRFSQECDGYEPTPRDNSPFPNMDPPTRLNSPRDLTSPRDSLSPRLGMRGINTKAAEEIRLKLEAERIERSMERTSSSQPVRLRTASDTRRELSKSQTASPQTASPAIRRAKGIRQRSFSIDDGSQDSRLLPRPNFGKGTEKVPHVSLSKIKNEGSKATSTAPASPTHSDMSTSTLGTPRTPKTPTGSLTPHSPKTPNDELPAQVSRSSPPWKNSSQDSTAGLTPIGKAFHAIKNLSKSKEPVISPTLRPDKNKGGKKKERPKSERLSSRTSPRISGARSKDTITSNVRRSDGMNQFIDK